ncbi:hypothetical protein BS47DRAFT_1347114 [Hydnum rufescens UP504]|uniref:Camp independent regulatory protein n=1 Tax=Hydnum rufescens UP504 TaxID=1448309 RepID=A0A9P6ASE5_9AGAM|nr:hypothetical protein BS47DRAFT_1347114 [Hydnum rufescens UP504]
METSAQNPTHPNLRVTTSADARDILYLVECGWLHPVKRRPDDAEKARIGHGSVFVWLDGAKGETGLERWTDGRQWAGSRRRKPRLTKSTYTARRNTTDDDGSLWHLIAYYYSSQVETLNTVLSIPEFAECVSSMAHGYFVSSRKDKSRKVKEIPPPVKTVPYSIKYGLNSPTSPMSAPPIIQVHQAHASRSPTIPTSPNHNVLTEPHYTPPFQHSGKLTRTPVTRPQLSVSVLSPKGRHQDQGRPPWFSGNDPVRADDSRPAPPKIYAKVFAHDYHHLPGPEDVIRDGGGVHGCYSSPSPSSPGGLSPVSSDYSPFGGSDELVMIPLGGRIPRDVKRPHAHREMFSVRHESLTLPTIADMDLGSLAHDFAYLGPGRLPEDEKALQKLSGSWPSCF